MHLPRMGRVAGIGGCTEPIRRTRKGAAIAPRDRVPIGGVLIVFTSRADQFFSGYSGARINKGEKTKASDRFDFGRRTVKHG